MRTDSVGIHFQLFTHTLEAGQRRRTSRDDVQQPLDILGIVNVGDVRQVAVDDRCDVAGEEPDTPARAPTLPYSTDRSGIYREADHEFMSWQIRSLPSGRLGL